MQEPDFDDLPATPALQLLAAIDAEQNALLEQLEALNLRIEQVLQSCNPAPDARTTLEQAQRAA